MRRNRNSDRAANLGLWIAVAIALAGLAKLHGAEPPIDWPNSVEVGQLLILDAPEDAQSVAWSVYPDDTVFRLVDSDHAIVIETKLSGMVIVALANATGDPVSVIQAAIVIGDGGNDGDGIDPPVPPVPTVGKLHVLLLYEQAKGGLTQSQSGIPTAKGVLEYLRDHCADEGGTPAYRFLDPDADIDGLPDDWQTVFNRGLAAGEGRFPWLIIASDQGGTYEGPLPADMDAMMDLLQVYGGE